jgi:hypothetical protein
LRALIQGGGLARSASKADRIRELLRSLGVEDADEGYEGTLLRLRSLLASNEQAWARIVRARDADLAERFDLDGDEARVVAFVAALQSAKLLQVATDTLGPLTHAQAVGAVASIVDLSDRIVATVLSPARRLTRRDFIRLAPDALGILRHRFGLGSPMAIELAAAAQSGRDGVGCVGSADAGDPSKPPTARESNQSP